MLKNKLKIADIQSSGDRKRCCLCKSDFGLCYDNHEKQSIQTSTNKLELKINAKITRNRLSPIYPYKFSCGHRICNSCFDDKYDADDNQNKMGFYCPVCDKPLGKLTKNTSTAFIDFEQFGRACYNSLYNQFRLNYNLSAMNTVFSNNQNVLYIKADIDRFILKCGYCVERLTVKNQMDKHVETNAEFYCITCHSVYCDECFEFKHSQIDGHCKLDLGQISVHSLPCRDHRQNNVQSYCNDCKTFVCLNCSIKYEHKKHNYKEFYSSKERQTFLNDFIVKFKRIKQINSLNLENIKNDLKNIIPNDLPTDLIDKYLFRNNLIDLVNRLSTSISESEQSIFILNELLRVLNDYLTFQNNILLKKSISQVENEQYITIKSNLNEYVTLLTFEQYEPIDTDRNEIITIDQILQNSEIINDSIDTNNNCLNQTLNPAKPPSRFSSYKLSQSFTESLSNQIIKTSSKISLVRGIEDNLLNQSVVIKQSANEIISKDVHLDRNKSYVVKLVCFHSPNDFWIRLNSKDQCYRNVVNVMDQKYPINGTNDFFTEEESSKLKNGDHVAHFSISNSLQLWTRAQILEISINQLNERMVKVVCYDFGVVETIIASKLKKIDPILLLEPPTAFHCFIHNLVPYSETDDTSDLDTSIKRDIDKETKWFTSLWKHVYNWAGKRPLSLKIYDDSNPNHYGVDLFDRSNEELASNNSTIQVAYNYHVEPISLAEMLVRCKMAKFEIEPPNFKMNKIDYIDIPRYIPMKPLLCGEKITAGISLFLSLKDFKMRKLYEEDADSSFKLDAKMQTEYNSKESDLLTIFEPYVGMPVAALFIDDKRWYRAEVIKILSNSGIVSVYFVDYGNTEKCQIANLKYLKNEFFVEEVAIFRCKLFGIKYLDSENYIKAADYFYKTTFDICQSNQKTMKVHIKDIITEPDSKTLSIKTSKIHEIILRYPIEDKLANINVLFTKLGYADITNLSIHDGEKDTNKVESHQTHKLKQTPTNFQKEILEVSKMPNKMIKFINDTKIYCKVTNAVSPNEIWVQDIVDSEQCYEKFQKLFNENYIKKIQTEMLQRDDWEKGDLCVLKTVRKLDYFRAKIVERFPTGNFKLICLDTGNYESNIKPENLLELVEEFRDKPEFKAKKCCLIGVQPTGTSNGFWSSLAKNYTADNLNDQCVYVSFKSDKKEDDSYDTVIYVEANDKTKSVTNRLQESEPEVVRFAEMLNSQGLAFLTEKKLPIMHLMAKISSFKNISPLTANYDQHSYPDIKLNKQIVNDFETKKSQLYDCVVTNVVKDTKTGIIYLRFLAPYQTFDITKKIQDELDSFFNTPGTDNSYSANFLNDVLKKNRQQACVCRFKDNKLYRCEILNEMTEKNDSKPKKYQVIAIDYGYEAIVSLDSIFRPMVTQLSIERQAYKMKLNPELSKYSKQNFPHFLSNILKSKLVSLEISSLEKETHRVIYGDLKIKNLDIWISDFQTNNQCLNDALSRQETLPCYLPCPWPGNAMNISYHVEITYQEEFNIVWVQFNTDVINQILREFKEKYDNNFLRNLSIEQIEENRPCACLYPLDLNIYRAQIISVNYIECKAKVLYIDFGDSHEIEFRDIYELEEKYLKLPKHTIRCKLKDVVLDQQGVGDLKKYQEDIEKEIAECFETEEKLYAIFSKPNSIQQMDLNVEIYINSPDEASNAYLAYQTLVDKNKIELISII